jgi:hypothetical protein
VKGRGVDLREHVGDVDATVGRPVGGQAPRGLFELPLEPGPVSSPRVVPRDGDVDEALEEVALTWLGRAPEVLQHLVRFEIFGAVDQLEPALELRFRGRL